MKLRTVSYICKKVREIMNVQYVNENGRIFITNHREISNGIAELIKHDILVKTISEILKDNDLVLSHATTKAYVDPELYGRFVSFVNLIGVSLRGISETIDINLGPITDNSINVKLPSLEKFSELSDVIRDFNNSIANVMRDDFIKDEILITGFDNGSLWMEITLNTAIGINILGAIVWSGYAIMNKKIEYEKNIESLKSIKIANFSIEDMQKGIQDQMKLLIQAEAKAIAESKGFSENMELISKLEHSIERSSILLKNGMELHPGQKATQETIKEFPKIDTVNLIEPKAKLLTGE